MWRKDEQRLDLHMHLRERRLAKFLKEARPGRVWVWADKWLLRLPRQPRLLTSRYAGISMLASAVVTVIAGLFILAVVSPNHSSSLCGPGSAWKTVAVGRSVELGGRTVTVKRQPASAEAGQKSVTLVTHSGRGQYRVVQVNDDMGPPYQENLPVQGASRTFATDQFTWAGAAYGPSTKIASLDVCWSPLVAPAKGKGLWARVSPEDRASPARSIALRALFFYNMLIVRIKPVLSAGLPCKENLWTIPRLN